MTHPTLKDVFAQAAKLIETGNMTKLTVSTAESCTGGLIGAAITAINGSSSVFKGGIISYDNSVKTSHLGVSEETLKHNGAVSAPVCRQMALGALSQLKTDIAVSVTGVAGPSGGSPNKPVGTVWMGIAWRSGDNAHSEVKLYNLGDIGRNKVRDVTVFEALKQVEAKMLDLQSSKS